MKKFEAGKTYYAWTQKGEIRLLKVTAISKCGTALKGIYHNNKEAVMYIKGGDNQWVEADKRYKVVVTADEYKPVEKEVEVVEEIKEEQVATEQIKEESAVEEKEEKVEQIINPTSLVIPKKYQHMIEQVSHDIDGWFVYLRDGYISPSTGCHTIHEYTKSDTLKEIRRIIEREEE